ncbi:MAG TPA: ATP-binding cassette domain-containing protein [Bacillota bacterium]
MPITVQGLIHTYQAGTPFAQQVLFGVDLEVGDGEIVGITGRSRSGKSTLAQFLCGLLRPRQPGMVTIDGVDTGAADADIAAVRTRVGLVFQYPEDQLFERTVALDVGFAPRLLKMKPDEVEARVREALSIAGLPYEEFAGRPVHALSGGQKRRVAIAGVLAKGCRTLILDEPTAGLDPVGREEILDLIASLHRQGLTVVMISNQLEELARMAQRLVVLDGGRVVADGPVRQVAGDPARMEAVGLRPPATVAAMRAFAEAGLPVRTDCLTVDEVCDEIARAVVGRG